MTEIFEQPLPADVRYYKLRGPTMQRADGLERIHQELQGIGVSVWDAEKDTARTGGGQADGKLEGEIAMLEPLEKSHMERVRSMGASIVEMDPNLSHLHWEHIHKAV
jgi:hypothetical protein